MDIFPVVTDSDPAVSSGIAPGPLGVAFVATLLAGALNATELAGVYPDTASGLRAGVTVIALMALAMVPPRNAILKYLAIAASLVTISMTAIWGIGHGLAPALRSVVGG